MLTDRYYSDNIPTRKSYRPFSDDMDFKGRIDTWRSERNEMGLFLKQGVHGKTKQKNLISMLVNRVRNLDLRVSKDRDQVEKLSKCIFTEWKKVRSKYRNKLQRSEKTDKRFYADCEAEEEIMISLIILLNEKIIQFCMSEK